MNQNSYVLCFFEFDMTIINQSMTNTLDTYHLLHSSSWRQRSTKSIAKKDARHTLIILVVLLASFCISEAK